MLKPFDNEKNLDEWNIEKMDKKKEVEARIDGAFLFSVVWSFCITVTSEYRKPCNDKFKKLLLGDYDKGIKAPKKVIFPDRATIYDHMYNIEENKWHNWMDLVNQDEKIPKNIAPQEIIVTTPDKVRYSWILKTNIKNRIPTLFVGPTGTGKSIYVQNVLNNDLEKGKFNLIEIGFSAKTTAE